MNDTYKTPGQLVEALLREREWTQRVLAAVLDMSESTMNKLISGKQAVSAEIAIMLEEVFAEPAERFLALQKDYELATARVTSRADPDRLLRAKLLGGFPLSDMIKRGWLDVSDIRDVAQVERELIKFFGTSSMDEVGVIPHAAKKTGSYASSSPAQIAWLRRVKQIAGEMLVGTYSEFGVKRASLLLKELLLSAESARKVPRMLAECGIRFVVVETLPGAKIDGACCWLNDSSPVIGMSMRHDRIDNFWFVLRHELEHVIRGDGKEIAIVDSELEGERAGAGMDLPEFERLANAAAADFCVPGKTMDSFIARKAPFFAERDILGVAATLKVHPGLVAGQLQNRTGRYDRFRNHLVKVRSIVTPNAINDGWGNIAPIGA